jgi:hypothetical protein
LQEGLTLEELQAYCNSQYAAIHRLSRRVNELEIENSHLKTLLEAAASHAPIVLAPSSAHTPAPAPVQMERSAEQLICEMELEKLKTSALERELSLEEVKRMDLLVKNLYLSKGKNTAILGKSRRVSEANISEAELLAITSLPKDEEDEDETWKK